MQNARSFIRWSIMAFSVILALAWAPAALAAAPSIGSMSPAAAVAGGAAFTLTITGTNFTAASNATWGATALATTYESATELTASVPASLVVSADAICVTVSMDGDTSSCATFTINPPPAAILGLSPASAVAPGVAHTIHPSAPPPAVTSVTPATGSTGPAVLTPPISGTIPSPSAYLLTASSSSAPLPSSNSNLSSDSLTTTFVGASKPAFAFSVNPPPTITSLSPTSTAATGATFTLTINGTNYLPGAGVTVVRWSHTALTTTYVSSTQLTAVVPASLIAHPGMASISVVTAGGTSSGVSFTVNPAPPIIIVMGMTRVPAGFGAFTLNIYGTNFTSTMVANFGATPLTATLVGGITLPVTIPASLVATAGKVSVTVTTAGGTSAPVTFVITPPLPAFPTSSRNPASAGAPGSTLF